MTVRSPPQPHGQFWQLCSQGGGSRCPEPGRVIFAALAEPSHPRVRGRGGNGFRKSSGLAEEARGVAGLGVSLFPSVPMGLLLKVGV